MRKKQINLTSPVGYLSLTLLIILFLFAPSEAATQIDITGPAGSGEFGNVTTLPNGNIVVVDPKYDAPGPVQDVGAVYLYNGATGALISMMTGTTAGDNIGFGTLGNSTYTGAIVLSNGNFLILSSIWNNGAVVDVGAITLCSGTTGCSGTVSAANSLVGSTKDDMYRADIKTMPNGNYVVFSTFWSNGGNIGAGATTFCSGITGCSGVISNANSLVGSKAFDANDKSKLTVLNNGNYVVSNPSWDNGTTTDAGAVTWCSGVTGCTGFISAANSLIGSQTNDLVGVDGVTALTGGNYVVGSSNWANGTVASAGASTFCNGATGCIGSISAANSLVGTALRDQVGNEGVTELANGKYVVVSDEWDYQHFENFQWDSGAVTLCNGTTGCTGAVSETNSLVGFFWQNYVGNGGIVALPNGNYVVHSPAWDYELGSDNAGAVTFCSGTTGCTGLVSPNNSLHGQRKDDLIGISRSVVLPSGDYVVFSPYLDGPTINEVNLGAATWCSGTTGCSGTISAANSLIGTVAGDNVGRQVTVLPNGNYLVISPYWDNGAVTDVGAVTYCNGAGGCTGTISSANSLTGSSPGDQVGSKDTAVFPNGSYIVSSPNWDNGGITDAGAVTLCNGVTGCSGTVSAAGSLTGSNSGDQVGDGGVIVLSNGNYVVASPYWNNGVISDAGAVTWCKGSTGCDSTISASNSLIGSSMNDHVGSVRPTPLANGNYIVHSPEWSGGGVNRGGAITLGAGNAPLAGAVSFNNSVRGNAANLGIAMYYSYDAVNERLIVGRPLENTVSLFRPTYTAIASGNWSAGSTWDYGAFAKPQNTVVRAPYNVTVDTNIVAASVFVFPSAGLMLNGDRSTSSGITLYGTLDLNNNNLDLGENQLTLPCALQPPTLAADSNGYIIGRLSRCRQAGSNTIEFPVGTASGYSPVTLTNISSGNNATFRVKAVEGAYSNPTDGLPSVRLARWWELTNGGLTQADVQFNYLASDINGDESNYRVYKIENGTAVQQNATINPMNHTATVLGVTSFSDWTLANAIPTAASVSVGGRVVSARGSGVSKATVSLTDNQGNIRTALTNGFGYYKFENVSVGETYVFSVSTKQYQFTPQVILVNEDIDNLNFAPVSNQKQAGIK